MTEDEVQNNISSEAAPAEPTQDYVSMMGDNELTTNIDAHVEALAANDGKTPRPRLRRTSALFRKSIRQSFRRLSVRKSSLKEPLYNKEEEEAEFPTTDKVKDGSNRWFSCGFWLEAIRYLCSMTLLGFSIVLVTGCIFTDQTSGTASSDEGGGLGLNPILVTVIVCLLLAWLAVMEGGQGALVGLKQIETDLYADSHVVTSKITSLAYQNENTMERFIVGRQFLVVLVVFGINTMASAVPDASLWNLDEIITDFFLGSGLALIMITLILGQLVAQVNAADCMLDFINNHIMLVTTYLALGVETLGLLHCTYLVQMLFSKKKHDNDNGEQAQRTQGHILNKIFLWLRVILSLALLGCAFAVTLSALFNGQTTTWEGFPNMVSVILFFVLMCLVGIMEGMQIALFAVINIEEITLQLESPVAHRNCRTIFGGEEAMQAFLIGRQICVTVCTFLIARITTISVNEEEGEENVFGVSDGLQSFFNTGLLGAVITTIIASLVWRIVASSFPIAFLSNPLVAIIIRVCLFLERSGTCSAAWVLARLVKAIMKYEPDEVYLDAAEPTHGSEPTTERDEDIDRLFMRSSIVSLQADITAQLVSLEQAA